jgi:hypothetical protein
MQQMTLEEAVTQNKKIKILAYSVSDNIESRMKEVLGLIFKKYDKLDMVPPVYTCLKELLVNAVKANFKTIYFEGYSSKNSSESIIDYEMALKLFKLELSRENAMYLEKLARKFDMKVEVLIHILNGNLHISVTNPVEMTDREKFNVQNKLACARQYNDIAEYFAESDAETETLDEGAGLGIILISMMLKNMGVSGNDFKIISEENKTVARLVIPLSLSPLAS